MSELSAYQIQETSQDYIPGQVTALLDQGCTFDGRLTFEGTVSCLLYTSPSPRDRTRSRMPSSA